RAFLAVLDGSCRTPIAGHARIEEGNILFRGMILRPDGNEVHETARRGAIHDGATLGADAARELRGRAAPGFFAAGSARAPARAQTGTARRANCSIAARARS